MKKKMGGIPVWVWGAVLVGGLIFGSILRKKSGSTAATINTPVYSPTPAGAGNASGGTIAAPAPGIDPTLAGVLTSFAGALVAQGQTLGAIAMNSTNAALGLANTAVGSSFALGNSAVAGAFGLANSALVTASQHVVAGAPNAGAAPVTPPVAPTAPQVGKPTTPAAGGGLLVPWVRYSDPAPLGNGYKPIFGTGTQVGHA